MVDQVTAKDAIKLLGTAMGELLEDHAHEAVTLSVENPQELAGRLASLGSDVTTLALAIGVLHRRQDN